MSSERLPTYLDLMQRAISEIAEFIDGIDKEAFVRNVEKQRAVGMNLVIIGELAGDIIEQYPEFAEEHPDLPWRQIRGMRNRLAHAYFDTDLTIIWETARKSLPGLRSQLESIRHWQAEGE